MSGVGEKIGRGLLGSIRKRVKAEVAEHMVLNKAVSRYRHPFWQRALRSTIGHSFWGFLFTYAAVVILLQCAAVSQQIWWPNTEPFWITPSDTKGLLKDGDGFMITAQVGILGVISVAVGLITLITQRNDGASANADIRIYYSESLAYGVVSSSIALLLVMCVETFWPLQFLSHLAGVDQQNVFIKVALTAVHEAWLCLNLAGFAQFLLVSLHFVEPKARERLRQEYTVNTVLRLDLRKKLNAYFLLQARQALRPLSENADDPYFAIGPISSVDQWEEEMKLDFRQPTFLRDIRLRLLNWAILSWWRRADKTRPRSLDA